MKKIQLLGDEAEAILLYERRDIDDFGLLLDETWKLKRRTGSAFTNAKVDELYAKGIRLGALGGKILGAGGGGFLLFYARKEQQESLRCAMGNQLEIPFRFETEGTSILYCTVPMISE